MLTKYASLCEAVVKLFKTKVLEVCYELVFFEKIREFSKALRLFMKL